MRYLILSESDTAYAKEISAALYALSRPDAVRGEDDVTDYWFPWIVHPETGRVAIEMTDTALPIHVDADPSPLQAALMETIPADERAKIATDVAANRGKRAKPAAYLPASVAGNLVDRATMEADRWFVQDDTEAA